MQNYSKLKAIWSCSDCKYCPNKTVTKSAWTVRHHSGFDGRKRRTTRNPGKFPPRNKQVIRFLNLYYFRVSSRQQNDFHLQDTHHPQFQESNEYSNNAINPIHWIHQCLSAMKRNTSLLTMFVDHLLKQAGLSNETCRTLMFWGAGIIHWRLSEMHVFNDEVRHLKSCCC